jgi:hypothetical protein
MSYIPSREALLDDWLTNFKALIVLSPTTYGLQVADGTAIQNSYNSWHAAYLAAINPTTRTKSTVITKNEQKSIVLGVVRGYAATIRANRAVTDENKNNLGLHVAETTRTPVPPPSTQPVLEVVDTEAGLQVLAVKDEGASRRGKPTGVAGVLVYRAVAADPVSAAGETAFLIFTSKTGLQSNFTTADRGKIATYFARWTNAKGEVGPWSDGVSSPIAA